MEEFAESLATLRSAIDSPLLEFEEVPPPSRMAPFTAALVMRTVANDGREPLAQGRFVILHDPDEQAGWNGTYRLVAQLRKLTLKWGMTRCSPKLSGRGQMIAWLKKERRITT